MVSSRPRIIFLPGMGADARLIEPQRATDADIEVPPWIEPKHRESLADYGRRVAATIDPFPPFFLGGVSLGGMIAQEAARHLAPRGLILLSTCRCAWDLGLLRRTALLSAYVTPAWAMEAAKSFAPVFRSAFNPVNSAQNQLLSEMLNATDPRFLRWSMRAISARQGCEVQCPTLHIHGRLDRIIPIRRLHPTHIIEQAGHVANLTHAAEVNRLIDDWIRGIAMPTPPARADLPPPCPS